MHGEIARRRRDHAHVLEPEQRGQLLAVVLGLAEQLAGIEEDHRRRRVDGRHHVEQHDALGAERGDQRGAAGERPLAQQRAQQGEAVERAVGLAQAAELVDQAPLSDALLMTRGPWTSRLSAASRWRRWSRWSAGRAPRASAPRAARRCACRRSAPAAAAHSGPNAWASWARMRAARPGLLPAVETVSSRSPRRTCEGLWKSQKATTSSTLTRQPPALAARASGAASAIGRSAIHSSAKRASSAAPGRRRRSRSRGQLVQVRRGRVGEHRDLLGAAREQQLEAPLGRLAAADQGEWRSAWGRRRSGSWPRRGPPENRGREIES